MVKPCRKMWKKPKLIIEINEPDSKDCICVRPAAVFQCLVCKRHMKARLSITCKVHPNVMYLMSLRDCPYCSAVIRDIKEVDLTWEQAKAIDKSNGFTNVYDA